MKARIVFAILMLLAVGLLIYGRIPSLSNDFCDPDLAGIAYGAGDLLQGGSIYPNCVETKPPGVYLIFASSFKLFGHSLTPIYALALILHAMTLLALAWMAHRSAGTVGALAAAWLYALLAISHTSAANCPNYESWMTFFAAFGLLLLNDEHKTMNIGRIIAAGALLSLAFLMKQQALIFVAVAVAWILLSPSDDERMYPRALIFLGVGFAMPLVFIVLLWFGMGGLGTMLHDLNPLRLSNYVGAGHFHEAISLMLRRFREHSVKSWPAYLGLAAGVIFYISQTQRRNPFTRYVLYLVGAFAAVVVGSRFYAHYMIILAAPLALCAGYGIGRLEKVLAPRRWRYALYSLFMVGSLAAMYSELHMSALALSATSPDQRMISAAMFTPYNRDDPNLENRLNDKQNQDIGRHIALNSQPDDTIYVWPYYPQIYFWAQRRSPTRHYMYFEVAANLAYDLGGWHATENAQVLRNRAELMAALEANRPRFVVLPLSDDSRDKPFTELDAWVKANYRLDEQAPVEKVRLFVRND